MTLSTSRLGAATRKSGFVATRDDGSWWLVGDGISKQEALF